MRCACGTAADGVCAACGNVCRSVRIVRDGEALFNSQQTRNGLKFGRVKGRREIVKTAALRRSLIEEHVRRHDAASTEEKERRVVMGIAYGERKYACSLNEGEQLSGTDEAVFLRFFQLMSTILVQGKRRPQPLDPTLIRGEYIAHCRANQSLLVRTVYAMLYASTREKDFAANMTENTMDVRMARACTISDIMLHTANPGSTYSWQRFIGVQLRGVAATPSVKKVLVRYGIMSENECATMRDLRSKLVPMDERARDGGVVVMTCQDNCHFVKVGIAKGEKRVHVFTNVLKMVIDEDFCEKTGILDACRERPRTAAGAAEAEGEDDIMVPQSDDDPANGDIDDLIGIISPRLQHAFECYIRAVRIGTGSIQVGGIDEFSDEANAEQIRIPKYYSSRVAKHAQIVAMKGRYEGINTEVQDADPSKIDDVRSLVEYSKKMGEDFVKHVQPHLQQVAQHLMEDGIHYHGDCGPIYLIHRHNMRGVVPRLGGFHTVGEMIHLWWRMFEYTHLRYFVPGAQVLCPRARMVRYERGLATVYRRGAAAFSGSHDRSPPQRPSEARSRADDTRGQGARLEADSTVEIGVCGMEVYGATACNTRARRLREDRRPFCVPSDEHIPPPIAGEADGGHALRPRYAKRERHVRLDVQVPEDLLGEHIRVRIGERTTIVCRPVSRGHEQRCPARNRPRQSLPQKPSEEGHGAHASHFFDKRDIRSRRKREEGQRAKNPDGGCD